MKKDRLIVSRRLFIIAGLAAPVALWYATAVGRGTLKACGYHDIEADLQQQLQPLIRIGKSYLKQLAQNGERGTLDEALLDEREFMTSEVGYAMQKSLLALERKAREEFARSETIICDGWVLAKSEAGFCAMIAMLAASA